MEKSKESNAAANENKENPVPETQNMAVDDTTGSNSRLPESVVRQPARRPFTTLSQLDADLALARTLQEQVPLQEKKTVTLSPSERAYMMLRMAGERSGYASSSSGSFVYEDEMDQLHDVDDVESHGGVEESHRNALVENEGGGDEEQEEDEEEDGEDDDDLFDVHGHEEIDPAEFESDEAYARALQDAEERELAVRMMAFTGIHEWESNVSDENGSNSQDAWQEVDPDELSYEELLALGEAVGTQSRGLSADMIASLPSSIYKSTESHNGTSEQCVICRLDYEEGDRVIILSCKHTYHSECINNWLKINKVCPVCNVEVSMSTQQEK